MSNWTPLVVTTRRIAGRIRRASLAGFLEIRQDEEQDCVSAITNRFLSTSLRQKLGIMWFRYGKSVVEGDFEDRSRRSEVDDSLDELVCPPAHKTKQ